MKITYKKLEELGACEDGLEWFCNEFGIKKEVEFKDLLKCNDYKWISWLIGSVPAYQTFEILELYLSMKSDYDDLRDFSFLIANVPAYQTTENLELYLAMKPNYNDFSWLIENVPAYQTTENYEILKQMKENL